MLSLPADLQEAVLARMDAPSVAAWASACRASAASVRAAYGAALAGLKGDGQGGPLFACLAEARRRRCAELGAADLEWGADALDVFASDGVLSAGPCASSFLVHIDTADPLLIRRCLDRVAALGPRRVHISPSGVAGACRALGDRHRIPTAPCALSSKPPNTRITADETTDSDRSQSIPQMRPRHRPAGPQYTRANRFFSQRGKCQ